MAGKQGMTPGDTQAKVVRLAKAGRTRAEIMDALDITSATISYHLRRARVTISPTRHTPGPPGVTKALVLRLRAAGLGLMAIARQTGLHRDTVRYHLTGRGRFAVEAMRDPMPTRRRCPVCHGIEDLANPHQHQGAA